MIMASIGDSTRRAYNIVLGRLEEFCGRHNFQDKFSSRTIELFVIQQRNSGLGDKVLRSSLSAIRFYCKANDLAINFDSPRLQLIIRRVFKTQTPRTRPNMAFSLSLLTNICNSTHNLLHGQISTTVCALFTFCFFGQLRLNEAAMRFRHLPISYAEKI